MKVAILCIGDELLKGAVINTNLAYMGQRLLEHGIMPELCMEMPDTPQSFSGQLLAADTLEEMCSKTIGANISEPTNFQRSKIIAFLPEDDSEPIKSENFKPIKQESVNRSYIDEYEIEE